jgi:hypothetical protein
MIATQPLNLSSYACFQAIFAAQENLYIAHQLNTDAARILDFGWCIGDDVNRFANPKSKI